MSPHKIVLHLCCAAMALALASTPAGAETRVAESCSRAHVWAAINAASPGDTVSVPAGPPCSWTAPITLPDYKDVTLLGAGIDQTVLTCVSAPEAMCFVIPNSVTTRISGFTFNESNIMYEGRAAEGKTFRLDHNKFFAASTWRIIDVFGGAPVRHPTGLIDHNDFHNYGVHINGTDNSLVDGPEQHQLWAQTPPLGSGTGVVYIEDNAFVGTFHQNAVDGNYAARFVFRFNTLSGITYAEVHSVQGANRAVQMWELYNNQYTKLTTDWYPLAFVRGGTGVIFGNRMSATYTNDITVDNVRSCRNPGEGVGKCDGSSNWDQNTGLFGYACRDQVGRGKDSVQWSPGSPYAQPSMPAYFWDNLKGASTPLSVHVEEQGANCDGGVGGDLNSEHLAPNRDWYNHGPSFDGTTGVGVGTLAARPVTCTEGVGYWATDQGEWNSKHAGADGQLYKCTASNSWSLYYRPHLYPHPLTLVGSVPTAPSGLRITH